MNEINWDLAPEGATAIVQDGECILVWANGEDDYWDTDKEDWVSTAESNCSDWVQVIATRPTTKTRKTVKDAVDYFDGVWANNICNFIISIEGVFWYSSKSDGYTVVCTREEFEQEVARREGDVKQEWTHFIEEEDTKCRKHLMLEGGEWVYYCDDDSYFVPNQMGYCGVMPINPIARTLTRAEAEKQLGCIIKD